MNSATSTGSNGALSHQDNLLLQSNFSSLTPPVNTSRNPKKAKSPVMDIPIKSPTKDTSKSGSVQHVPCKFFKNGACTAGKNCVFSHSKEVLPGASMCKYYLKGNCKFGNKCALQHGNEKKQTPNMRNSLPKNKLGSHFPQDRQRSFESRSFLDFSDDSELLSRNLSRMHLDNGFNGYGLSNPNMSFYTPQPKTSQLSSIFGSPSPSQSKFSISLPTHQKLLPDEKGGPLLAPIENGLGGVYPSGYSSSFGDRFRTNGFMSPNFNFNFSSEQALLPSSLDELLTPTELQMRRTKANALANSNSGSMNRSHTQELSAQSPFSKFLSNYESDNFFGSSLPSGSSLGFSEQKLNENTSYKVPNNSLFSHSLSVDSPFPEEFALSRVGEHKEESDSQNSDPKKPEDNPSSNSTEDEVPFEMDGDF